jgi:hypothetical protein
MQDYQYRYTQIIDGRIATQSQFLLQISEVKGEIRDNILGVKVERIGEVLLKRASETKMFCSFNIKGNLCEIEQGVGKEYRISEMLAMIESAQNKEPIAVVKFSKPTKEAYFICFCLPTSVDVVI